MIDMGHETVQVQWIQSAVNSKKKWTYLSGPGSKIASKGTKSMFRSIGMWVTK